MCGIAGIVALGSAGRNGALAGAVRRMMAEMVHRGPDDWGLAVTAGLDGEGEAPSPRERTVPGDGPGLALGHRRLSILDLSESGRQPMATADGMYWIVLNGEIYNYIELRDELMRTAGVRFSTRTDTEVLLEGYRTWGRAVLERLDGMFAFAVWDVARGELFCARDPMGIKPFYFSTEGERFTFASEPRAVLAGLGTRGHVDEVHLADYVVFGATDHDEGTFFREVRQLPGGCWMTVGSGEGVSAFHRYWSPPEGELPVDAEIPVVLGERLGVAVSRQLRSDVPVGSCLSGGLDSGAIAVVVGDLLGSRATNYTALTLRNEGFADDESELARVTARKTGLTWRPVDVGFHTLAEDVEAMARHLGEPFTSLSMFAQYKVMEAAGKLGLKVMLDGQGGDEVYVGYERIVQRIVRDHLRSGHLARALHEWNALAANASISRVRSLVGNVFFSNPVLALARNRRRMARYFSRELVALARREVAEELFNPGDQRAAQVVELTSTCLPRLLRYEDRNSMAFSVEARVPHLSVEILDLALRFPARWRVRDGWSKYALRRAMEGKLPDEILWNPVKRGFDVPQGQWLRALRPRIDQWLDSVPGDMPLCVDAVRQALDGSPVSRYWFWRCLSVALWIALTGVRH